MASQTVSGVRAKLAREASKAGSKILEMAPKTGADSAKAARAAGRGVV